MMSTMTAGIAAFDTELGTCAVRWTEHGIASVRLPSARTSTLPRVEGVAAVPAPVREAIDGIRGLLAGESVDLGFVMLDDGDIDQFRRDVYAATRAVPPGSTATYGEVARAIGRPTQPATSARRSPATRRRSSSRATASLGANGKLTGFSAPGGLETKRRMLTLEGAPGFGQQVLFG